MGKIYRSPDGESGGGGNDVITMPDPETHQEEFMDQMEAFGDDNDLKSMQRIEAGDYEIRKEEGSDPADNSAPEDDSDNDSGSELHNEDEEESILDDNSESELNNEDNSDDDQEAEKSADFDPEDLEFSEEELESLSPKAKNIVQEMQKHLDEAYDEVEPYQSEEFKSMIDAYQKDPVIQSRLENLGKIQRGESVYTGDKVDWGGIHNDDIKALDFKGDPEGTKRLLQKIIIGVHNKALQAGENHTSQLFKAQASDIQMKNDIDNSIPLLMQEEGIKTDKNITDSEHPMFEFTKWMSEMPKDHIKAYGVKGMYALYMDKTGKRSELISNAVARNRKSYIKKVQDKAKEAVLIGKKSASMGTKKTSFKGVDLTRYTDDQDYAMEKFNEFMDKGDVQSMQALEYYGEHGKLPKAK